LKKESKRQRERGKEKERKMTEAENEKIGYI